MYLWAARNRLELSNMVIQIPKYLRGPSEISPLAAQDIIELTNYKKLIYPFFYKSYQYQL